MTRDQENATKAYQTACLLRDDLRVLGQAENDLIDHVTTDCIKRLVPILDALEAVKASVPDE